MIDLEKHPLQPFLPSNATTLFLGSFPPPKARWSMEFFYPNWINDFWRIMGLIFFGDKGHFEVAGEKRFDKDRIVAFAREQGLAFFDTATTVRRLKGNASDNFLEIVEPTDVSALLSQLPQCHRIVTTGGKASEELQSIIALERGPVASPLPIGSSVTLNAFGREITWYRMPSTSRAYPLSLTKKAKYYKILFPRVLA